MATENQANLTLEFHQEELFKNQNLAYLAVVAVLDDLGQPTDEFVLEAGVYNEQQQIEQFEIFNSTNEVNEEFVPNELAIPSNEEVKTLTEEMLKVNIIQSDGFKTQTFRDRRRPANGGCSVMNFRYNSAGTLGAAITLRGQQGLFFISNWHVLVGGSGRNGDSLIQPGRLDGGRHPQDRIGTLHWSRLDSNMDAAIGRVVGNTVGAGTRCFGRITGIEAARVGMNVRKCGRTTRHTTGRIRSINASIKVSGYPGGVRLFSRQILTTHMSQPGDSGSVICNSANNRAIGLLFAGDGRTQTIANHLNRIIGQNMVTTSVTHQDGSKEEMPEIEITGFAE